MRQQKVNLFIFNRIIFFGFLVPCGGYGSLLRKSFYVGSLGQALEWNYAASKSASILKRWGPVTVDEDLSFVVWTWLSAAARWVSGSSLQN